MPEKWSENKRYLVTISEQNHCYELNMNDCGETLSALLHSDIVSNANPERCNL